MTIDNNPETIILWNSFLDLQQQYIKYGEKYTTTTTWDPHDVIPEPTKPNQTIRDIAMDMHYPASDGKTKTRVFAAMDRSPNYTKGITSCLRAHIQNSNTGPPNFNTYMEWYLVKHNINIPNTSSTGGAITITQRDRTLTDLPTYTRLLKNSLTATTRQWKSIHHFTLHTQLDNLSLDPGTETPARPLPLEAAEIAPGDATTADEHAKKRPRNDQPTQPPYDSTSS